MGTEPRTAGCQGGSLHVAQMPLAPKSGRPGDVAAIYAPGTESGASNTQALLLKQRCKFIFNSHLIAEETETQEVMGLAQGHKASGRQS